MSNRLEAVVLVPLDTTSTLVAMIYFSERAWWIAAWFVIVWLLLGGLGASLHPEKTPSQLAAGTVSYPTVPSAGLLKIGPHQAARVGAVMLKTSFALGALGDHLKTGHA
ncbi:MAG: hypothetical protein ACLQVG_02980 [Terriglobia bacterium]